MVLLLVTRINNDLRSGRFILKPADQRSAGGSRSTCDQDFSIQELLRQFSGISPGEVPDMEGGITFMTRICRVGAGHGC